MRHIISILLQNEAGALTRVTSLFSTRGYNIESLSVAPTEDAEVSRLTMVANGSDAVIDQIGKQLFKLVDVVSIIDMTFSSLIAILLLVAYNLSAASGLFAGLILLLVFIWALRMSVYLVHRNWGHGEDPRYTRLRSWVESAQHSPTRPPTQTPSWSRAPMQCWTSRRSAPSSISSPPEPEKGV